MALLPTTVAQNMNPEGSSQRPCRPQRTTALPGRLKDYELSPSRQQKNATPSKQDASQQARKNAAHRKPKEVESTSSSAMTEQLPGAALEFGPPQHQSLPQQPNNPPAMEQHPPVWQPQPEALPTLHDLCAAHWPTLAYVPTDIRDEWADIFADCLAAFIRQPTIASLTQLFFCSKGLLAAVRHGGKSRQEAVNRTMRARVRLWRAGRFGELWQRLLSDHSKRTTKQRQKDDNDLQKEASRVARLVKEGQLLFSRPCAR